MYPSLGLVSVSQKLVLLPRGSIPLLYSMRGGVIVSATARKTIFLFICIFSLSAVHPFVSPPAIGAAQAATFLTPPYFGTKTLNAVWMWTPSEMPVKPTRPEFTATLPGHRP